MNRLTGVDAATDRTYLYNGKGERVGRFFASPSEAASTLAFYLCSSQLVAAHA